MNVGHFEIRGELGQGAMAKVWRAWDPKLEREVAIKEPLFTPDMSAEVVADLRERFLIEGQAAARLNHENIVTVYSADMVDNRATIVMELLDGAELTESIRRKSLSGIEIYNILRQLLNALSYAHKAGVVHRDIKPDNVFLTSQKIVKLTDFGVAHVSRLDSIEESVIVGSAGYISPEQLRGEAPDIRSDLFSFSVIAYELLAYSNPFGAYSSNLSQDDVLLRMQASEQLPPFENLPNISSVIARGLRQNPNERWSNALEYLEHLEVAVVADKSALIAQRTGKPFSATRSTVSSLSATQSTISLFSKSTAEASRPNNSRVSYLFLSVGVLVVALIVALASGSFEIFIIIFIVVFAGVGVSLALKQRKLRTALADDTYYLNHTSMSLNLRVHSPRGIPAETKVDVPLVIGRNQPIGSVHISDGKVSRQHVKFLCENARPIIKDLNSSNGTYLNGRQIRSPEAVKPGDWVQIGDTALEILEVTNR